MKVRVMLVREGRAETPVEVSSPGLAYLYLRPKARNLDREHFWRIDLDARNRIISHEVVSIGTLTASLVHPREVFVGALLNKAAGVIIGHTLGRNVAEPGGQGDDEAAGCPVQFKMRHPKLPIC